MNLSPKRIVYISPKWQIAAAAILGGTLLYSSIPILFPHYTRRYNQYYNIKGDAVVVGDHTLSLLDSLLTEMKMPHQKAAKLDLFITSSVEPQFYGSFNTKRQALIGLPINFNWTSKNDMETSGLLKKDLSDHDEPTVLALTSGFMLSKDEKEFILARQLGYLDSHHFWSTFLLKIGAATIFYSIYHFTVDFSGLHIRDTKIKAANIKVGLILAGSLTLSSFVYNLFKDAYICSLDKYADKYAGTISPRLAQAGVSYYQKRMYVNRTLRTLTPNLANKITPTGNQVTGMIRTKTLPFLMRKNLLEQLVLSEKDQVPKTSTDAGTSV